uniref:Uncharacterized protein n=1 Tax=Arundo donax TaxID=35708 RepID=A0A0A9F1W3_ARUDO
MSCRMEGRRMRDGRALVPLTSVRGSLSAGYGGLPVRVSYWAEWWERNCPGGWEVRSPVVASDLFMLERRGRRRGSCSGACLLIFYLVCFCASKWVAKNERKGLWAKYRLTKHKSGTKTLLNVPI